MPTSLGCAFMKSVVDFPLSCLLLLIIFLAEGVGIPNDLNATIELFRGGKTIAINFPQVQSLPFFELQTYSIFHKYISTSTSI